MKVSKLTIDVRSMRMADRVTQVPSLRKLTATVLLALLPMAASASGQTTPALRGPSPEWARIMEGLKRAKPMPDPKHATESKTVTPPGDLVRFDPRTRNLSYTPHTPNDAVVAPSSRQQGHPGSLPQPATGDGSAAIRGKVQDRASASSALNGIRPADITPTKPSPDYYPYTLPFNTEFRLLMRFPVAGFADQYYLCSASSASDFHLLSAAHCVYNHDPLDDGSGRGAGFAAEIWAWPAETDVVDPIDPDNWPDFPYGVAKMTYEVTYNAWIANSDLNWDFSFISLDRRIGDHVGWMGREWGVNASSLNFDGYPAEAPYVPSDNPYQYPGFDSGNVVGYTCCRIAMDAYTYGGHSGGGVWRYDGTNRYIEGVNSTSNRAGSAAATLFTAQTHTDLANTIAADQSARPPQDRPQLIEYVFNGTSKGLLETSVLTGSSFGLKLNAFNAGYNPAGATTADIYLTGDETLSTGTYIGTLALGSLDAYTYTVQAQNVVVPASVPPNTYFVGWVINGANAQYGTDKNRAIITQQTLTVVGLYNVSAAQGSVTAGQTSTGTVRLTSPAPAGGVSVSLSSNNSAAKVPGSVFIAGGSASATFSITTTRVSTNQTVTIKATAGGVNKTTTLTVTPAVKPTLSLSPATVTGGHSSKGKVTINLKAPSGGITIALSSSSGSATLPATVLVKKGSTSATFTINTSKVKAKVKASIQAKVGGASATKTLTITP